jgi:iron complex outermembrane receptor protein
MLRVNTKSLCLATVSAAALSIGVPGAGHAQSELPAVTVVAPQPKPARRATAPSRHAARTRTRSQRSVTAQRAVTQPSVADGSGRERGNGPVTGYLARQSETGTKTDTPIIETPQSISVVTRDQVAAQQAQSVAEALRYTPGVMPDIYGTTTNFDAFKIRGFSAPRFLDGLRLPIDPGTQFAMPRIEPYDLERLEVLKGPSSGLYGSTDPGGLLNMISKRPQATPHYEAEGTFGSFERFQGAFDIGGPIDRNGEFLYRIVGLARQSNTQTDYLQDNKLFIAPSLTWRPTTDTNFTLLAHYQKIDNKGLQQYQPGGATYLPNPYGHLPYSRYLGEPGLDGATLEQGAIGYAFDRRFTDYLRFSSNFRYTEVSNDTHGTRVEGDFGGTTTGVLPDFRSVPRTFNYVNSNASNIAADNHLQFDFATGPVAHKLLAGVDYFDLKGHSDYKFSVIAPIDGFAPVYGVTFVPQASALPSAILSDNSLTQTGIYLQDQVSLDRWRLTLTGRHDWASTVTANRGAFAPPSTVTQNDAATTGRVGLSYLFDSGVAPYINYSTSFVPSAGTGRSGAGFRPTTGEGKEVGIKFRPNGMNLMLTGALFDITQNNVLTPDPANVNFSVQTGQARVRGFELEARGNVTRELELIGGYTHLIPTVTRSNAGNVGLDLVNVARDVASLWAKYTWYDGPVAGLGVGAGVRHVGAAYVDALNVYRVPAYTVFDATVSYDLAYARPDLRGWKAQVNVINLTDHYYMASCLSSPAYCGPGTGRTVLGTLKYSWNADPAPPLITK